ncbi:LAS seventeen-binding protein 3 [Cercospora zeina]
MWQRVKTGSKAGFDKAYAALDKLGPPINRVSNKLGSEAFWPTTLDKESDKAARILKSFCRDGFYAEEEVEAADGPKQKQKVLQNIPEHVIRNAKGLAIFTTMRTGLWISGAGGSGVLIARKEDGTWSPPSGIMLHTAGLGFLIGVDIYDCVVVINSQRALDAFSKVRCTLGGEVAAVAGPCGAGGTLETSVHEHQAPVYTYLKSRGFYAGVQIDGTIIIERMDENERFYGQKLPVAEILAGKVHHPPYEIQRLLETIKAAQGDADIDESLIPTEAAPGDCEIDNGTSFGVPKMDDPDPYGVLALEKEGMTLKEAGTQKRASWEQFSFNPSPMSPIYPIYTRQSQDLSARPASRRSSWRSSAFSADPKTPSSLRTSLDRRRSLVVMADTSTQTDTVADMPPSPSRRSIGGHSQHSSKGSITNPNAAPMQDVPEHEVLATPRAQDAPNSINTANGYTTPPHTPPATSDAPHDLPDHDIDHYDDVQIIEQSVVHSVHSVQPVTSQTLSKARIVNVPKRLPPKLPPRNPGRNVTFDPSPLSRTPSPQKSPSLAPSPGPSAHAGDVLAGSSVEGHQGESAEKSSADADSVSPISEAGAHIVPATKLETISVQNEQEEHRPISPITAEQGEKRATTVPEAKEKMPESFDRGT